MEVQFVSLRESGNLRVICTAYYIGIRIFCENKCSSKPEFNVNRVLLPFLVVLLFLVVLHHWRWPCNLHNPKCHSSPGYPYMKQCHCSHKGMDIGISYLVVHFHVCKKFFQVLYLMSNIRHLVVLLENLLPHLSILECCLHPGYHLNCGNILKCHLDPGHYQSWMIGSGALVW